MNVETFIRSMELYYKREYCDIDRKEIIDYLCNCFFENELEKLLDFVFENYKTIFRVVPTKYIIMDLLDKEYNEITH